MVDREKVIKGLEMSYTYSNCDGDNTLVPQQLVLDALALLKAQEPVTPKKIQNTVGFWCECGFFLGLRGGVKYCAMCGRAVKWE